MFHCTNTKTLGPSAPLPVMNPAGTIHRVHWRPEHRATGRSAQWGSGVLPPPRSAGSPDHSTARWSDQLGSTGWLDPCNNSFNTHHRDTEEIWDLGFSIWDGKAFGTPAVLGKLSNPKSAIHNPQFPCVSVVGVELVVFRKHRQVRRPVRRPPALVFTTSAGQISFWEGK
jgi:hypothetical protein